MPAPERHDRSVGGAGQRAQHAPAQSVVRGAIAAMHGKARLVLALHFYENLGPATIAGTLGAPIGEVERLIEEGKAGVAQALGRQDPRSGATGSHVA